VRTKIAIALMQLKAATGLSLYKLGGYTDITGPTMSKWFLPAEHKYHRNPTEEQVLKIFVAVAFRNEPPDRMRELLEVNSGDFMRLLDAYRQRVGIAWGELAERACLGTERIKEFLDGDDVPTTARLRLVVSARCTRRQVELANRLLQAGNYYVLTVPGDESNAA
jgi:hypothetical protein